MKRRRRGLALLLAGVALIGAGLLGLRTLNASATSTFQTVQPSPAELHAIGLKSARLFRPYRTLAVYTWRAPDFKRYRNGSSGTFSQVLAILGTAKGAVLAVVEPVGPSPQAPNEAGWQTVLAPARNPVQPRTQRQLGRWQAHEVSAWLESAGLVRPKVSAWPFPGNLLVVVTEDGQSAAMVFPASSSSTNYIMGPRQLQGWASATVFLKPAH